MYVNQHKQISWLGGKKKKTTIVVPIQAVLAENQLRVFGREFHCWGHHSGEQYDTQCSRPFHHALLLSASLNNAVGENERERKSPQARMVIWWYMFYGIFGDQLETRLRCMAVRGKDTDILFHKTLMKNKNLWFSPGKKSSFQTHKMGLTPQAIVC